MELPRSPTDMPKFNSNELQKGALLGRGAYADVNLVNVKSSKKLLAMKQLHLKSIKNHEEFIYAALDLIEEGEILSSINHENIVTLQGLSETEPSDYLRQTHYKAVGDDGSQNYFLLMDVLQETLEDRLKRWSLDGNAWEKRKFGFGFRKNGRLGRRSSRKLNADKMLGRIETVATGIARAMEYLHNQDVIFRDLKPDNVGFDLVSGQVKLFDFGFARRIDPKTGKLQDMEADFYAGTPRYMAPEAFQGAGSKKADVYSFGMTLYAICTLKKPFKEDDLDLREHVDNICSGGKPCLEEIPLQSVKDLIQECLGDANKRPSFEEIANIRLPSILATEGVLLNKDDELTLSWNSETYISETAACDYDEEFEWPSS